MQRHDGGAGELQKRIGRGNSRPARRAGCRGTSETSADSVSKPTVQGRARMISGHDRGREGRQRGPEVTMQTRPQKARYCSKRRALQPIELADRASRSSPPIADRSRRNSSSATRICSTGSTGERCVIRKASDTPRKITRTGESAGRDTGKAVHLRSTLSARGCGRDLRRRRLNGQGFGAFGFCFSATIM